MFGGVPSISFDFVVLSWCVQLWKGARARALLRFSTYGTHVGRVEVRRIADVLFGS